MDTFKLTQRDINTHVEFLGKSRDGVLALDYWQSSQFPRYARLRVLPKFVRRVYRARVDSLRAAKTISRSGYDALAKFFSDNPRRQYALFLDVERFNRANVLDRKGEELSYTLLADMDD